MESAPTQEESEQPVNLGEDGNHVREKSRAERMAEIQSKITALDTQSHSVDNKTGREDSELFHLERQLDALRGEELAEAETKEMKAKTERSKQEKELEQARRELREIETGTKEKN